MNKPQDVNESQWQAIEHGKSHLLIVAGPGTGKTHTLIYRIEHLSERLTPSQKILAITFTKKAAQEMLDRLKDSNHSTDQVDVGTFHQFCLTTLRAYQDVANVPNNFSVASEEDINCLMQSLWPDAKRSEQKNILETISRQKSIDFHEEASDELNRYNRYLREKGLLDFDDLILETVNLFKANNDILSKAQQTYRYILVDEYQDINPIQRELLKLLVQSDVQITAIGDPNQAIYGFRGSDTKVFDGFKEDFLNAEEVVLKDNYRSAESLLSASTQVIAQSSTSFVPELTAQIYAQGRLHIYESPTAKAEAEYVVHTIEKLIGGTSMFSQDSGRVEVEDNASLSFGDIAVLYRMHAQGNVLAQAFERSGIPYHIAQSKKEETLEICPQRSDDVSIDGEKVSLMTLHAAKGLEFSTVFLVGCEDHLLPLTMENLLTDVEEEQRLFYVGMTRAKTNLFMTYAKKRTLFGQFFTNKISPFVLHIEESLRTFEEAKKQKVKSKEKQLSLFG